MPRRMRLSDRNVARLRAERTEYTVWDTRVTRLGVRVRPSGYRTFVFLDSRGGSSIRRTLGPVTLMGVEEARAKCLDIQSGGEKAPQQVRSAVPAPLFRDFVAGVWRSDCYERLKPSSRRIVDIRLASQLLPVFGVVRIDQIGRKDVNCWFDLLSATTPGGANRTLDLLGQILNYAKVHGHVEANPASGIRRNPGRKFNRFLSRDEINRLHAELDRSVAERPSRAVQADVIRLLFYTGCRSGEIRNLKLDEVGDNTLDLRDSKTGPRKVYLNSEARVIIKRQPRTASPHVFRSPMNPSQPLPRNLSLWRLVRKHAGIEDVRLHDLRHNFASWAVMRGVPLPTVARLLGHRQVSMTLRYAHVHDNEVEAAAERVGTFRAYPVITHTHYMYGVATSGSEGGRSGDGCFAARRPFVSAVAS